MSEFIAIVKAVPYRGPNGGPSIRLTELELVYPDGGDCGVPLYVGGYEEACRLLRQAGATAKELEEYQAAFDRGEVIRIALSTDDEVVEAMGFQPRKGPCNPHCQAT